MRVLIGLAALLAGGAWGEKWTYKTIPETVVAERLQRIERGANGAREEALEKLFSEAGCTVERMKVKGSKESNLLCRLEGAPEGKLILVTAHFDKVRAGAGAIDNWSGASMIASLYETLRFVEGRRHTFLFIGFADEEAGLVGSRAWVNEYRKTLLKDVRAVVNIDSIASGAHPMCVWVSKSDKRLVDEAGRVAAILQIPLQGVNADKVGLSDTESFREKKVPTIDFHSLTNDTIRLLHTIDDQLSKVDSGAYHRAYRYLAAYLQYLDGKLDASDGSVSGGLK